MLTRDDLAKLNPILSLTEAAAMCAGYPHSRVSEDGPNGNFTLNTWDDEIGRNDPYAAEVFEVVLTSLVRAVTHNQLPATVVVYANAYLGYIESVSSHPDEEQSQRDNLISQLRPDKTTVHREDLNQWFLQQGVKPEAFFPKSDSVSILDQSHHCYAPKLAALCAAWLSVVENGVPVGSTAKQTIKDYLVNKGSKFTKDGQALVSKTGADELAAIANWDGLGEKAKYLGDIIGVDPDIFAARQNLTYELHKKRSINQALIPDQETFLKVYHNSTNPPTDDDLPF